MDKPTKADVVKLLRDKVRRLLARVDLLEAPRVARRRTQHRRAVHRHSKFAEHVSHRIRHSRRLAQRRDVARDVRRDVRRVLISQNVGDDLGAQQRVGRGGPLGAKREPLGERHQPHDQRRLVGSRETLQVVEFLGHVAVGSAGARIGLHQPLRNRRAEKPRKRWVRAHLAPPQRAGHRIRRAVRALRRQRHEAVAGLQPRSEEGAALCLDGSSGVSALALQPP